MGGGGIVTGSGGAEKRVSVVVPTRDRPSLLAECLESIRAVEGPDLALEILVADNGPAAETRAVAEAHGATYLSVLRPGAGAARNAGLAAATGEYIAFLDDDDLWLPGHLRPHMALLEARAGLEGVVGQVLSADMQGVPVFGPWPSGLPTDGHLLRAFMSCTPQIGATVVRASVRETVGGFDEDLLADQDWDWHLRLAERHQVGFVAQPCVLFRHRPPGLDDELQAKRAPYTRRVFLRHVRAFRRSGSSLEVLRAYFHIMGAYTNYFSTAAEARCRAGDHSGALGAIRRSLRLVPVNTVHRLLTSPSLRRTLTCAVLRCHPDRESGGGGT